MTLDAKSMDSTPVETEFYDYYGLSYSPFSDYPHEVRFFQGEERQSLLDQLQHLSRYSHAITAVIGEQGVGKTFICQELLKHKDEDIEYSVVSAVLLMSETQFITEIIQGFAISVKENSGLTELQTVLLNHIDNLIRDDRHCVITVDDAHELSAEAIQLLMALLNANDQNLHVILFGETQLETMLSHIDYAKFNVPPTNFLQLEPLSREGARQYIEFRLSQAGYTGEIPLLDKQLENIYKQSAGIPRLINIHTHNQLIENISQPASVKLGLPVMHMVALVVTTVLLVSVFFWGGQDDEPAQAQLDAGVQKASPDLLAVDRTPLLDKPLSQIPDSDSEEIKKIVTSMLEESDEEPFDLSAVNADNNNVENDQELLAGNQQLRHEQFIDRESMLKEDQLKLNEKVSLPDDLFADEQTKPDKNIAQKSANSNTKERVDSGGQFVNDSGIQQEDWILNIDPGYYTLQILGSHSEQSVKTYINSFKNKQLFAYYETSYKSQSWFVIVYGQYENRQQALVEIPKLHRKLRKQKPWVRSIATIHEDIRKYQNN